ncbi:MAG: LON peptidase substrate-binding domain-containing protein [Saprospiraceae bacterium]|nr:LON peptidase substrate-binding domain-containing protein [Saprospiraceae bacterium]
MTEFFPLFPLQIVAFPGEKVNLHIFEPRYKQLIGEVDEKKGSFGMPSFIKNKVSDIGTELELVSIVKTYPNGELDIKTVGKRRFIIREFFSQAPGKLFPAGNVEFLEDEINDPTPDVKISLFKRVQRLYDIMNIKRQLPEDPQDILSFEIGHHVGLNAEQEYQLLKQRSEMDRQMYLIAHLDKLMPVVEEMEELRKKAQMNGHFKNIIPPKIG